MTKGDRLLSMQAQAVEIVQNLWRNAEWRFLVACSRNPDLRSSSEQTWLGMREAIGEKDPALAADLASWHTPLPVFCKLDSYLFEVLLRVAEIGTRKVFLDSTRHSGFCLAFFLAGESMYSRLPQRSDPEPPEFRTSTNPSQRRSGIEPSEFDIYKRGLVLSLLRWGLPIPEGLEASMPAPDEKDFTGFSKSVADAVEERVNYRAKIAGQAAKARLSDTLSGEILQDWLPRGLWRLSTHDALKALGHNPNRPHFVKAYDQALQTLKIAQSRDKSPGKQDACQGIPFVRPPSANGM